MGRKLAVLREHCQAVGRPHEEIEKTSLSVLPVTRHGRDGTLTAAAAVDQLAGLAALGIAQAIFNVSGTAAFDLLATEAIPEVTRLPVAGR